MHCENSNAKGRVTHATKTTAIRMTRLNDAMARLTVFKRENNRWYIVSRLMTHIDHAVSEYLVELREVIYETL